MLDRFSTWIEVGFALVENSLFRVFCPFFDMVFRGEGLIFIGYLIIWHV